MHYLSGLIGQQPSKRLLPPLLVMCLVMYHQWTSGEEQAVFTLVIVSYRSL